MLTTPDIQAFHIRGQNAGLIVRGLSGHFAFEFFEVAPTNVSVMCDKGRLRRTFPASAISIQADVMQDASFRSAIANTLAQLDVHTPEEAWPVVTKAKSKTIEPRDTIHPKFVTEMLYSTLLGMGDPYDAPRISKNTREDVLWDSTLQPWRRSPFYLFLRVVLQTSLSKHGSGDDTDYKMFMVFFMARVLHGAHNADIPHDLLFVMAAKIGRRTLKLQTSQEKRVLKFVGDTIFTVHRTLGEKWDLLQQDPDPSGHQHAWNTSVTSFRQDTRLSMPALRSYLLYCPSQNCSLPHACFAFDSRTQNFLACSHTSISPTIACR